MSPANAAKFKKRAPIYRALASMPPLSHWPNKPEPFDPANSEVLAFIRDAADKAGIVLEPGEDNVIWGSTAPKGVTFYDPDTGLHQGTRCTKRLRSIALKIQKKEARKCNVPQEN